MVQQAQSDSQPQRRSAAADMSVANNTSARSQHPSKSPAPPHDEAQVAKIPHFLPHERVFPIQIGNELFKLSGASISSDAPSYFSQYFYCQVKKAQETGEDLSNAIRTLYIDRDPQTFADISLHLQGYHVKPRDGTHFVRLFADAQFYSLPKLISQLYEESIFISIGHREFQIPRDIFTDPGNSPNFFSLGFAVFFSNPEDLFPGLDREGLLRPPSILPPSVPNRSADTFAEILHLLRGYPVTIRNESHRAELLRDCRYFNFKGLEQKLIPHHISHNQSRRREEILLRLEDILKSGISVAADVSPSPADHLSGWVNYARPYVDDRAAELVLEIGGESTRLHFHHSSGSVRAEFFKDTRARVARLFEVVATKLNLPPTTQPLGLLMASGGAGSQPPTPGHTPLSEDLVRVSIDSDTSITLDGRPHTLDFEDLQPVTANNSNNNNNNPMSAASSTAESPTATTAFQPNSRKRRRVDSHGFATAAGQGQAALAAEEWVVRTGQWRLKIQGSRGGKSSVECVLVAVKLDAYSSENARNANRGFLNG
ncbi:BTB/POZ domain-containing protein [Colletotrichum scovillei]|uniref:BTB/POZ domain-containing protein n=1 Tax=Colletotrichum scovillei TaxID=1209932 RepID=A0A9P7UKF1_9PEZI|nr:BTB/POZ domain-containing protein [Colletotrichum scovillei]KAF4776444.1 BTB/POZ domain-containing protein [Colletotrichum scovillei]KAG7053755.1 BTB/POZ domain-containing protein [Colletotrichum scovillei]KAG7072049.1 BTB/POZ domain-containing protein [Colletotrichum scovillei]KAG7080201.1 BTB/POZ domain-containing protein [Colletotrichum scovillei]